MNELQMIKVLEQYGRKHEPAEGETKVTRVQDYKTVYIEQIEKTGRSIILREFHVDGKTYWAGYSSQSDTVFISQTSRD